MKGKSLLSLKETKQLTEEKELDREVKLMEKKIRSDLMINLQH